MMNSKPHPYFNDHKIGVEDFLKESSADIEMQKLCFEIFMKSEDGQKLYVMLLERFLIPGLYKPEHPHATALSLYFEGFKEAFRGLMQMAKIHQLRIERG